MTRCTECGQFSHGPLCATHVELKEEVRVVKSSIRSIKKADFEEMKRAIEAEEHERRA